MDKLHMSILVTMCGAIFAIFINLIVGVTAPTIFWFIGAVTGIFAVIILEMKD